MSSTPASRRRAPASSPPNPPPMMTTSTSSVSGSRSSGATYGSSTYRAKLPATSMYWSLPSTRMRLSRSSRYFWRSASGSNASSGIGGLYEIPLRRTQNCVRLNGICRCGRRLPRMTDDLAWLDATAQADLVRRSEVSPQELVDAAVSRIDKVDGELHSVIHRRFDEASREAAGDLPDGPFRGVPFLVKDLYAASAGDPMHNGTSVLRDANYVAPADSWLVARYRAAGFVIVGRTNTPEFGLVPTTEPVSHGATHNPWSLDHTPGGSSGGGGAAGGARLLAPGPPPGGGGGGPLPPRPRGRAGPEGGRGPPPPG